MIKMNTTTFILTIIIHNSQRMTIDTVDVTKIEVEHTPERENPPDILIQPGPPPRNKLTTTMDLPVIISVTKKNKKRLQSLFR